MAVVITALIVVWALSGGFMAVRRRDERIGLLAVAAAVIAAVSLVAREQHHPLPACAGLGILGALSFHLLAVIPDGSLAARGRRNLTIGAYAVGAVTGVAAGAASSAWPMVLWFALAIGCGITVANRRYRRGGPIDRRRMQWVGWALVVLTEVFLVGVALRLMATWPTHPLIVLLATTALVPLSLVAASHVKMIGRVDRLLTDTVAVAGLTALVIVTYCAVVIALGRSVRDGERSLLLLSMVAAVLAALAYQPLRLRLANVSNQIVYGERIAPDDSLRTWGSRLTRAIPLDELLLQLAESLRKSMSLDVAEIYTGSDGRYDVAAGVPHRERATLVIGAKERAVVARAGVSGGTWLDVWIPTLAPANSSNTRVAPIAHGGRLLGMIVITRRTDGDPFTDENDQVITELARQVGLALHNVQLDSALQASLEQLQRTNVELQESRLRIVSAGDAERRKLERNLHDGAQQHLVAMAVKLRMAEELVEDDPEEASKVIGELRNSLKDAIVELRALAHGIFPPLLSSGGLNEALPAAAARAALITTVEMTGLRRYSPEIESTVYFCCLEAMQNAGKHAGDDAEIAIDVTDNGAQLLFVISDDGVGFEPGPLGARGHGFVNMTDRLGAVGGHLQVESAPGHGTTLRCDIPLPA